MELPKNITQIGESDKFCKIYAEDYVVSYLKQLNRVAGDKNLAVALYGTRKEEAGISYLFVYGAGKLHFLQRESRHLSQAVQQEVEKLRQRYFREYSFLGYKLLNGEMIEGFQICEQGVCRYISGYAQFYEKNDSMLAYMLEERQEEAAPEQVEQEKYDMVRKRQEERRLQAELEKKRSETREKRTKERTSEGSLRRMKYSAAIVFAALCVAGLTTLNGGNGLSDLRMAAGQLMDGLSQQQIPDAVEVANYSAEAGTIVAEDKLAEAIRMENDAVAEPSAGPDSGSASAAAPEPAVTAIPEPVTTAVPEPAATAVPAPTPDVTPEPPSEPTAYVIKRGDTLIGICMAVYGNDERLRELCDLNSISNPDDIKVGQKILLP